MSDAPAGHTGGAIAVGFAEALRGEGVAVPVGAVVTFSRALGVLGVGSPERVYWAGRATLVRRPDDAAAYDRAFRSFWWGGGMPADEGPDDPLQRPAVEPESSGGSTPEAPAAADEREVRYSAMEVLRHRDFASYTAAEHAEARRLMADVRLAGALRPSRRRRALRRGRGRIDVRRTVRLALRSDGETLRLPVRARSSRPRAVVLICDVSGSMEPYARALLRFVHAAVVGRAHVEAFTLGTRLTRVTRELSWRDPDHALAAASRAVNDWSGGTRLGEGIGEFNDRFGIRGLARGAVVVILSDGWDRGDPSRLTEEMARLARVAHRIVWVNPLKATPGYEPLARGMAAALPFVDEFVEGHSLAALERVVAAIGGDRRS